MQYLLETQDRVTHITHSWEFVEALQAKERLFVTVARNKSIREGGEGNLSFDDKMFQRFHGMELRSYDVCIPAKLYVMIKSKRCVKRVCVLLVDRMEKSRKKISDPLNWFENKNWQLPTRIGLKSKIVTLDLVL